MFNTWQKSTLKHSLKYRRLCRNFGFIYDELYCPRPNPTSFNSCYSAIRKLRCIRPYYHFTKCQNHCHLRCLSKLDYCNSLYLHLVLFESNWRQYKTPHHPSSAVVFLIIEGYHAAVHSGVTRGGRTAPGNTLQRGDTRRKKIVGKFTKNSGKRGRTGKKRCGVTPSRG